MAGDEICACINCGLSLITEKTMITAFNNQQFCVRIQLNCFFGIGNRNRTILIAVNNQNRAMEEGSGYSSSQRSLMLKAGYRSSSPAI